MQAGSIPAKIKKKVVNVDYTNAFLSESMIRALGYLALIYNDKGEHEIAIEFHKLAKLFYSILAGSKEQPKDNFEWAYEKG